MRVPRLFAQALSSNKMRQMRSITRYEPCNKPQTTNVQAAPCQSPPRNMTKTKFSAGGKRQTRTPPKNRESESGGKEKEEMLQSRNKREKRAAAAGRMNGEIKKKISRKAA